MANIIKPQRPYTLKQAGVILVLAPALLLALMALAALIVDLGYMRVAANQLQDAVDAAALGGANALINGNSAAISAADTLLNGTSMIGSLPITNTQVQLGTWDSDTSTFTSTLSSPTAVQVTGSVTPPLFFYNLFTKTPYTITKTSTASLIGGPRDIVFIVDLSSDMNAYSQLSAYPTISLATIESSLQSIYQALGSPTYGSMQWTPIYLTGNTSSILTQLGLTNVAYPYPSGSWSDYVKYVQGDSSLKNAGFANMYGYLTFVNYLESQQPLYSETPDLWKTPEQPMADVKSSIDSFIANNLTSSDQLALITYDANDGNSAVVEQNLTSDFALISSIMDGDPGSNTPGRQAAHYATSAHLNYAMDDAVTELNTYGRTYAQWIVYIFTGSQLSDSGFSSLYNIAQSAANQSITINVINVGSDNENVMSEIAAITGGTATQIPAGSSFGDTLGTIATQAGKAELVQ